MIFLCGKLLWATNLFPTLRMLTICFFLWNITCQGNDSVFNRKESKFPVLDARCWGMYGGNVAKMDLDISVKDIPICKGEWGYSIFNDSKSKQTFWDNIHRYCRKEKYQLLILKTKGTYEERTAQLERMFNSKDGTIIYCKDLIGIALGHEITTAQDKMENRLYDYIKSRWPDLQVYKFYSGPIKPYAALKNGNPERCDGYLYDIYTGNGNEFRKTVQKFIITGKPVVILIWASEPGWSGYFKNDLVGNFSVKKQDEGMEMETGASEQDGLIKKSPDSDLEKYFRNASKTLREFGLPVVLFGVSGAGSVNSWYWGNGSPNLKYIREKLAFPLRKEMRNSLDGSPRASANYSRGSGIEVVGKGDRTSFDYGKQQSKFRKGMDQVPKRILPKPYVDNFLSDDLYIGLRTIDHAAIRGFTHLRQVEDSRGVLIPCDPSGKSGKIDLIYCFYTKKGVLNGISASLTGSTNAVGKGINSIALSKNGKKWDYLTKSKPAGSEQETLSLTGGPEYNNIRKFYIRVRMEYSRSLPGTPANSISNLTVNCVRLSK